MLTNIFNIFVMLSISLFLGRMVQKLMKRNKTLPTTEKKMKHNYKEKVKDLDLNQTIALLEQNIDNTLIEIAKFKKGSKKAAKELRNLTTYHFHIGKQFRVLSNEIRFLPKTEFVKKIKKPEIEQFVFDFEKIKKEGMNE